MSQPLAAQPHILVVDDDDRLRRLLRRYLAEQGFVVSTAAHAADARAKLKSLDYDLMVLDVMMPGESGIALMQDLRGEKGQGVGRPLPVLLLTALGETGDRIGGLEAGADDYLTKPFEPRELLLRINAILRRAPKPAVASLHRFGPWLYDPARDELRQGDEVVRLTGMEAGLMRALAASPGMALGRDALAERSRSGQMPARKEEEAERTISERTIDVQVTRLRRKIEPDAKNPRYLVTVRGEGYMLMPDQD